MEDIKNLEQWLEYFKQKLGEDSEAVREIKKVIEELRN